MKEFINAMDKLSIGLKIILALPMIDVVWVIYRIALSALNKDTIGVIFGVVILFVGIPFLWFVDIITLVLSGKVLWINFSQKLQEQDENNAEVVKNDEKSDKN